MRVIWLRKKLAYYEPSVLEEGLVLHHGTNLPNLYRILESGQLGSEVGRHGGAYERLGRFYMTESPELAIRYAREAAEDEIYYLPEDYVPYVEDIVDEITPDINELKEVFGVDDLLDLYIAFASFMRYHGFLHPRVYPPVVITLVVTQPETLNKVYYDEDDFREWLGTQNTEEIIEVAKRDPEFYEWLSSLPEQLKSAEEISEYVRDEVEETFYETFPYSTYEEVSDDKIFYAAYHLTTKKIYEALVRLAERGDPDAHQILAQAKDHVHSFYFSEAVSFEQVDKATATIYIQPNPTEIDLKDAGALGQVKKIMEEQILRWARIVFASTAQVSK
jgi:hypothetical protein